MNSQPVLDRAALLAPMPRRYGLFEWPGRGVIRFRSLNVLEKAGYEAARINEDGSINRARVADAPARLIAWCVVDENDTPYLTKDDVKALMELDGAFVEQLFLAIHAHVYDGKSGSLETEVKNSESSQSEHSPST